MPSPIDTYRKAAPIVEDPELDWEVESTDRRSRRETAFAVGAFVLILLIATTIFLKESKMAAYVTIGISALPLIYIICKVTWYLRAKARMEADGMNHYSRLNEICERVKQKYITLAAITLTYPETIAKFDAVIEESKFSEDQKQSVRALQDVMKTQVDQIKEKEGNLEEMRAKSRNISAFQATLTADGAT